MTVRAARADKQKTKKRQTNDEEMMKDKACKIVEKVEIVEGDYGLLLNNRNKSIIFAPFLTDNS